MGLIAEFEIHCEALPLAELAANVPDAMLILELQFNHGNRPLFLVTARGGSKRELEHALSASHDVKDWTHVGRTEDTHRYQIRPALSFEQQLGDEIGDLTGLKALATAEAIIERIEVREYGWDQTGWFASRDAFSDFSSFWQQNAGFRLRRLTQDGESEPPGEGLTDPQHEALRTAYELGHFEIPRRASLEDVAAELDISASSVSERLRRAQSKLIEETVAPTWPPLPT
jgi:predicted DNA binding protein